MTLFAFAVFGWLPACLSNPTPHPGQEGPAAGFVDTRDDDNDNDFVDPAIPPGNPCDPDVYHDTTADISATGDASQFDALAPADSAGDADSDADVGPTPPADCSSPNLDDHPDPAPRARTPR